MRSEPNLPARQGHKRVDTKVSTLLTPTSFWLLVWRRLPTCDRCEIGERQSGYHCVTFVKYSQFTDSVLLHRPEGLRRRNTR